MTEDELDKVISSCIYCGNGISKHSLNLLSTTIHGFAENAPDVLVQTLLNRLCDYDSPIVPTRILLSISLDMDLLPPEKFDPIVHLVINNAKSTNPSSMLAAIHNSVFILPVGSLPESKATEVATTLVEFLHQTVVQSEIFLIMATAMSQFMKKWATCLTNPSYFTMSLVSLLSNASLSYSSISLISQSAIYIICAIIGDFSCLKEMIDDLFNRHETILDQCTAVSKLSFIDYLKQSIPTHVQYQLISCFLFTVPSEYHSSISCHVSLLYPCLESRPSDDIGKTCFFSMLSAILKIMSRVNDQLFIIQCVSAVLSVPDTNDYFVRKSLRHCVASLLQSLKRMPYESDIVIQLFNTISQYPIKYSLKQDSLPLLIPLVPFSLIDKAFFGSVLSAFDSHQSYSHKCLTEIYRTFDIPQEYSNLLFYRLEQMSSSMRHSILSSLLKTSNTVVKSLKNHVENTNVIDSSRRLSMLILLSSAELSTPSKTTIDHSTIESAFNNLDFEIRHAALKLLISSSRANAALLHPEIDLLSKATKRLFVYCDPKNEKMLENYFQMISAKINFGDKYCIEKYIEPLFSSIITFLKPHQSGLKKIYAMNFLKILWRKQPLMFLNNEVIENLVYGLFESSFSLREIIFRTLLSILQFKGENESAASARSMLSLDNKFVNDFVEKYADSPRFRESDGTARLIALVYLMLPPKKIEEVISKMWMMYINNPVPYHYPLSVILHIIETSSILPLDFEFITKKLIPKLIELIIESLDFLGIEANVESVPIRSIKGGSLPQSQLNESINHYWLAVRQAFNIISCVSNKFFYDFSSSMIWDIGHSVFRFLIDSRHFSTVYHAHLTFQSLSTRCFTREDCSSFPEKWTEILLSLSNTFSIADHRITGGFIQTALALLHSEPSHLFGSQRSIYHQMMTHCLSNLDHPTSTNDLVTALLLTKAIATDSPTQNNFEPYEPRLLMSVMIIYVSSLTYSIRDVVNQTICALVLRHFQRKKDETRDFETIQHTDFFAVIDGSQEFFLENISIDQPDSSFFILQVIQLLKPFPMDSFVFRIVDLRSSPYSRVRRASARALIVVLSQDDASSFIKTALDDIETSDSNTCDGILQEIIEIVQKYPQLIETHQESVKAILNSANERKERDYIKLYVYIVISHLFHCIELMSHVLRYFYINWKNLIHKPYGNNIIYYSFYVLSDLELSKLINSKDLPLQIHLIRFFIKNKSVLSLKIKRSLISLFLNSPTSYVFDSIGKLLHLHLDFTDAAEFQRKKYRDLLLSTVEESALVTLLSLAPKFERDPLSLLKHFESYSSFIDRSDSSLLETISSVMNHFHQSIFAYFDPAFPHHWFLALRIISDENPSVRYPCAQALSIHLSNNKDPLTEYDLALKLYQIFSPHKDIIQRIHEIIQSSINKDKITSNKEPPSFLLPTVFHIECLQKIK